ncbi:uncharacterized protein BJ171DRAFT_121674, partial [Polychytrium aggregatum]|uniref:uncharacterized protein n=1 Tax=Polychytrium aggregatum TaxID=110093 RepID=UPI0022FEA0FB
ARLPPEVLIAFRGHPPHRAAAAPQLLRNVVESIDSTVHSTPSIRLFIQRRRFECLSNAVADSIDKSQSTNHNLPITAHPSQPTNRNLTTTGRSLNPHLHPLLVVDPPAAPEQQPNTRMSSSKFGRLVSSLKQKISSKRQSKDDQQQNGRSTSRLDLSQPPKAVSSQSNPHRRSAASSHHRKSFSSHSAHRKSIVYNHGGRSRTSSGVSASQIPAQVRIYADQHHDSPGWSSKPLPEPSVPTTPMARIPSQTGATSWTYEPSLHTDHEEDKFFDAPPVPDVPAMARDWSNKRVPRPQAFEVSSTLAQQLQAYSDNQKQRRKSHNSSGRRRRTLVYHAPGLRRIDSFSSVFSHFNPYPPSDDEDERARDGRRVSTLTTDSRSYPPVGRARKPVRESGEYQYESFPAQIIDNSHGRAKLLKKKLERQTRLFLEQQRLYELEQAEFMREHELQEAHKDELQAGNGAAGAEADAGQRVPSDTSEDSQWEDVGMEKPVLDNWVLQPLTTMKALRDIVLGRTNTASKLDDDTRAGLPSEVPDIPPSVVATQPQAEIAAPTPRLAVHDVRPSQESVAMERVSSIASSISQPQAAAVPAADTQTSNTPEPDERYLAETLKRVRQKRAPNGTDLAAGPNTVNESNPFGIGDSSTNLSRTPTITRKVTQRSQTPGSDSVRSHGESNPFAMPGTISRRKRPIVQSRDKSGTANSAKRTSRYAKRISRAYAAALSEIVDEDFYAVPPHGLGLGAENRKSRSYSQGSQGDRRKSRMSARRVSRYGDTLEPKRTSRYGDSLEPKRASVYDVLADQLVAVVANNSPNRKSIVGETFSPVPMRKVSSASGRRPSNLTVPAQRLNRASIPFVPSDHHKIDTIEEGPSEESPVANLPARPHRISTSFRVYRSSLHLDRLALVANGEDPSTAEMIKANTMIPVTKPIDIKITSVDEGVERIIRIDENTSVHLNSLLGVPRIVEDNDITPANHDDHLSQSGMILENASSVGSVGEAPPPASPNDADDEGWIDIESPQSTSRPVLSQYIVEVQPVLHEEEEEEAEEGRGREEEEEEAEEGRGREEEEDEIADASGQLSDPLQDLPAPVASVGPALAKLDIRDGAFRGDGTPVAPLRTDSTASAATAIFAASLPRTPASPAAMSVDTKRPVVPEALFEIIGEEPNLGRQHSRRGSNLTFIERSNASTPVLPVDPTHLVLVKASQSSLRSGYKRFSAEIERPATPPARPNRASTPLPMAANDPEEPPAVPNVERTMSEQVMTTVSAPGTLGRTPKSDPSPSDSPERPESRGGLFGTLKRLKVARLKSGDGVFHFSASTTSLPTPPSPIAPVPPSRVKSSPSSPHPPQQQQQQHRQQIHGDHSWISQRSASSTLSGTTTAELPEPESTKVDDLISLFENWGRKGLGQPRKQSLSHLSQLMHSTSMSSMAVNMSSNGRKISKGHHPLPSIPADGGDGGLSESARRPFMLSDQAPTEISTLPRNLSKASDRSGASEAQSGVSRKQSMPSLNDTPSNDKRKWWTLRRK